MSKSAFIFLCVLVISRVLNASSNAQSITAGDGHDVSKYGPALAAISEFGIEGKAVEVNGKYAYVIGGGALQISDVSRPDRPKVLGRVDHLGSTRQIALKGDYAFIASRQDGMFVVDVRDPHNPAVVAKYDSIEFATGIAIGGDVAFLPCRLYGIELVDISNPRQPKHLSIARTGVSQSAVYSNGFLYVGVWGEKKVVVVEVSDPANPVIVGELPLDGYGDGVAVYNGCLFAATGQHSRAKPDSKPGDPGFGAGHGLEIFSLDDPARPTLLSRTKFPKEYHTDSHLWTVRVSNGHAFVVDNYNGFFVLDVKRPDNPIVIGHHQLPPNPESDGPHIATGVSPSNDFVVITISNLPSRVISLPDIAAPVAKDEGKVPLIMDKGSGDVSREYQAHSMDGQVYSVACEGDVAYVAAGQGGLHVIRVWPEFVRLKRIPTADRVMDVAIQNRLLYVAEGTEGIALWDVGSEENPVLLGRHKPAEGSMREIAISPSGNIAVLAGTPHRLHVVDISDRDEPQLLFADDGQGMLTVDNLLDVFVDGKHAGVYWHKSGGSRKSTDRIRWYDTSDRSHIRLIGETSMGSIETANGISNCRGRVIIVGNGGYRIVEPVSAREIGSTALVRVPGITLVGKPTVDGNRLYVSHRAGGEVFIVDIGSEKNPRLVDRFDTRANPAKIVVHEKVLLIPGGYEGLLIRSRGQEDQF